MTAVLTATKLQWTWKKPFNILLPLEAEEIINFMVSLRYSGGEERRLSNKGELRWVY